MILTLEILLILATLPLIWHSSRSYSMRTNLLFWLGGIVFALWRELTMIALGGIYSFQGFHLMLGHVPLVSILLWPNLSYISWQWANNLLGRDYLGTTAFDQHQPMIFLAMACLAFSLEAGFSQFGLVQWHVDSIRPLWGGTPLLAPFAYGFSACLYLKGFQILNGQQKPVWYLLSRSLLIQPLLVVILMGLLLVTNSLIVIGFS